MYSWFSNSLLANYESQSLQCKSNPTSFKIEKNVFHETVGLNYVYAIITLEYPPTFHSHSQQPGGEGSASVY